MVEDYLMLCCRLEYIDNKSSFGLNWKYWTKICWIVVLIDISYYESCLEGMKVLVILLMDERCIRSISQFGLSLKIYNYVRL